MAKFRAAFYKGIRPGIAGIYSHAVQKWERGEYSHVELVFSDGMSASASFTDKGVRFKQIDYTKVEDWDFIELPAELEAGARQWFVDHDGEKYDLQGNFHLLIGFIPEDRNRKFCSEAAGYALGFPEAWRFGPNCLAAILRNPNLRAVMLGAKDQTFGIPWQHG